MKGVLRQCHALVKLSALGLRWLYSQLGCLGLQLFRHFLVQLQRNIEPSEKDRHTNTRSIQQIESKLCRRECADFLDSTVSPTTDQIADLATAARYNATRPTNRSAPS